MSTETLMFIQNGCAGVLMIVGTMTTLFVCLDLVAYLGASRGKE